MATMKVRYIGPKDRKRDTVNGTDTVWNGFGDVKEVPYEEGLKLIEQHPSVWQDIAEHPQAPEPPQPEPAPTQAPRSRPLPMNEGAIAVVIEPDGMDPEPFETVIGAMHAAIQDKGYVVTGMSNDGQNVAPVEIQSVHTDADGNITEILTHETIDALPDSRDEIEAWGKEYLDYDVDKRFGPKKLKAALKAVLDLREHHIAAGTQATDDEIDETAQAAMEAV